MLILYSGVYLKKLWTVYELACFLASKPCHSVDIVHIHIYMALLFGVLPFAYGFYFVLWWPDFPNEAHMVIVACFCVFGS